MELLKDAQKRADSAEVYEVESHSIPVQFESGELESLKKVETRGAALRLINDGKLGFSTTTNLDDSSEVVNRAVETAKLGDDAGFEFPGEGSTKSIKTLDSEVAGLTSADLMEHGRKAIQSIKEFDSEVEVNVDVNRSVNKVRIANSEGLEVKEKQSRVSLAVELKDVSENDIFSFHEREVAQKLEDFKPEEAVELAIQKLKWARNEAKISSGSFPVVFTPKGTLVILLPLLAGFNGKNVFQGTSPLDESLGERLFSEKLSIADHGSIEGSPSRRSFDDEGLPVERTPLVESGIIKNFLYDLQTAGLASAEPTGNGLKGGLISGGDFRSPPSISPTSLLIDTGDRTFGKMIAEIDSGLVVDQVLGLGQGNPLSGEFSNNVSVAYRVKEGEIVGKVKNTMIAGNVYDLLENGVGFGRESDWIGGGLRTPPITVDGVNVVQKG
jgi:PmbA protein